MRFVISLMLFVSGALLPAQAPKVVSLSPAHMSAEVPASTTGELVVTFDRDMDTRGMSVVGGGVTFPKVQGKPAWRDARTFVMKVTLEAGHHYQMALNNSRYRGFRSKAGVVLSPVQWTFWTLPKVLPNQEQQRGRNERALDVLGKTLRERYSHYDLRVRDWRQLLDSHRDEVLAARTDMGFAAAAARMLSPAKDAHLYLQCDGNVMATTMRNVDTMFREPLLSNYVTLQQAGPMAVAGKTDDNIGYLLIASWTDAIDTDKIGAAIAAMADTKALIVDIRPNAGGDERLAREIAGWFVVGEHVYAKNQTRERAGEQGFGEVFERKVAGHGPKRRYRKPVALLTSRYVMSSGEAFVLMMKQADDCVVVGQPTFGSSGNPKPFDLGNEVRLMVPTWRAVQPDGSRFEGVGLQPDELVPCTESDFLRRDPILEKALEMMRARVGE